MRQSLVPLVLCWNRYSKYRGSLLLCSLQVMYELRRLGCDLLNGFSNDILMIQMSETCGIE